MRYANGTLAKIAIFCSNIKALEGIYSDVAAVVEEFGLNPAEAILKFEKMKFNRERVSKSDNKFDEARFDKELKDFVKRCEKRNEETR